MTRWIRVLSKRAAVGTVAGAALLTCGLAMGAGVAGQGTWEATLLGRDINGLAVAADSDSAVFLYDKTLDVTWLRDANRNGLMNWHTADRWANALTVGSFTGWRLPTMIDTGSPGCGRFFGNGIDCGINVLTKSGDLTKFEPGQTVYSEMAHLFYVTLGNKASCAPGVAAGTCTLTPQPGWGLTNTGSFQSLQPYAYWTTEHSPDSGLAWHFGNERGSQNFAYAQVESVSCHGCAARRCGSGAGATDLCPDAGRPGGPRLHGSSSQRGLNAGGRGAHPGVRAGEAARGHDVHAS